MNSRALSPSCLPCIICFPRPLETLYSLTHLAASRSDFFPLCFYSHTAEGRCIIEMRTLGQCLGFCLPFDQWIPCQNRVLVLVKLVFHTRLLTLHRGTRGKTVTLNGRFPVFDTGLDTRMSTCETCTWEGGKFEIPLYFENTKPKEFRSSAGSSGRKAKGYF